MLGIVLTPLMPLGVTVMGLLQAAIGAGLLTRPTPLPPASSPRAPPLDRAALTAIRAAALRGRRAHGRSGVGDQRPPRAALKHGRLDDGNVARSCNGRSARSNAAWPGIPALALRSRYGRRRRR
jgi:hypothetical protein